MPFVLKERERQNIPPPVYAFKCLLPVSSEMKGKVVCNASALSVSHLISCLTHYSDFSGQSSAKAVFLGFCSRLAFSSFPQSVNFTWLISCQLTYQPGGVRTTIAMHYGIRISCISTVCWQSLQSKWHRNKTHLSRRVLPNGLLIVFVSFTLFLRGSNHYQQEAYAEWHASWNANKESKLSLATWVKRHLAKAKRRVI